MKNLLVYYLLFNLSETNYLLIDLKNQDEKSKKIYFQDAEK